MMNRIVKLITLAVISVSTIVTPVMAATGADFDAEIAAYMAQKQQDSLTAKQNKAIYDATATQLQKQVDALIAKAQTENEAQANKAVAQLQALMLSTPDWSSNFTFPLTSPLPPRAVAIKTGYRFDADSIMNGDLRPFVWAIEDGEICSCNITALPGVVSKGGFHENFNYYLNPPTGGHWTAADGGTVYWGTEAEALIQSRGY